MTLKKLMDIIIVCGILLAGTLYFENARAETFPSPLEEMRYCGPPKRSATGIIVRSSVVVAAFKRAHPCPATGLDEGSCPGWQINHVIPLGCGGCDAVSNMEWMRKDVKTLHDGYERKIYGFGVPDTDYCAKPPIGGIQ